MPDPASFLDLLTKAGPWAVAIILYLIWRLERQERIDAQGFIRKYLEDDKTAKDAVASALRSLRLALYRKGVLDADQLEE